MPPNSFEVLQSVKSNESDEKFDVYVSYAKVDCPSAHFNKEFPDAFALPPSYKNATLQNLVDPRDIIEILSEEMNCKVTFCEERATEKLNISTKIKNSAIVVACLSEEYVKDKDCVEEFTFAKRSLSKVVIPIVVGPGGFEWLMSVVGLLIAGEMYIHFKERGLMMHTVVNNNCF